MKAVNILDYWVVAQVTVIGDEKQILFWDYTYHLWSISVDKNTMTDEATAKEFVKQNKTER